MAANDEDDDHGFGQSVPPLVSYLKGILREYSDGQILKELLQNAEDAGADRVAFLFDCRQYGRESLYRDSLAPYQGPALYSFNSAVFQDDDWQGIQHTARSNKKNNPLKVGRFGIGFNSVYHITDLPSIMSGNTLAFFDPLECHFFDNRGRVRTGHKFNLRSHSEEMSQCSDQFQPYQDIFPDVLGGVSKGQYDGTLFRFPLRKTMSELSDKIYPSNEPMIDLLEAFRVDADIAMLFLRNVTNVEVRKRSTSQEEPTLIVRVTHGDTHDSQARLQKKKTFCDELESYYEVNEGRRAIELTDRVTFITETPEETKKQEWTLAHLIAGEEASPELCEMAGQQSLLPWVAVAIPLELTADSVNRPVERNSGRIFCFLPLPPGEESCTGLPVHVHGYFAVNSDRRGIKWPAPDRTETPAQWNKLLVTELLPSVYVKAMMYSISMQSSGQSVSVDTVYRAWPQEETVREAWKALLQPFFETLFRKPVIHSDDGHWMKIDDVVFNELTVHSDMEAAILRCYQEGGTSCAKIPPVCRAAIKKYHRKNISTITASHLCQHLRDHPSVLGRVTTDEKLLILEFLTTDDDDICHLRGLPLLPLDDGTFVTFGDSSTVYFPTDTFHRNLIPGGKGEFVKAIPPGHNLNDHLRRLGGKFQVRFLTLEGVAALLKTTMSTWLDSTGSWVPSADYLPLAEWLDEIWKMLRIQCSGNIRMFEDIPLILACESTGALLPFCGNAIVQIKHGNPPLKPSLAEMLVKVGIIISECPLSTLQHPALACDKYIQAATPSGILSALKFLQRHTLIDRLQRLSQDEVNLLKDVLRQSHFTPDDKAFVRGLKLFQQFGGTGIPSVRHVSVDESKGYINCRGDELPSPLKLDNLIDGTADFILLQKLEIPRLDRYKVISRVVSEIKEGNRYSQIEKVLVMQWILQRWSEIKSHCASYKPILCYLRYVRSDRSTLLSPSELLDPGNANLQELFACEGLLPASRDPNILQALRCLGMRGARNVTPDEAISCVERVEQSQSTQKAHALLTLLSENQHVLDSRTTCGRTVAEVMKEKKCIPTRTTPPEYYPSGFDWYGESSPCLSSPREILMGSKKAVQVAGASVAFVDGRTERYNSLFRKLDIASNPSLNHAVAQLKKCVAFTDTWQDRGMSELTSMINELYSFLKSSWSPDRSIKNILVQYGVKRCVWNGSGFSEPSRMCLGELPFDIAPYLKTIPPLLVEYSKFLEALGVQGTVKTDGEALVDVLHEIRERCSANTTDTFRAKQHYLVVRILTQLQCNGKVSESLRNRLLVPARGEVCHLVPVNESAYTDEEWLGPHIEEDEGFTLIHSDVSTNIAKNLGVQPVSRLLLDTEDQDGFTQSGQSEPLTVRLWNILKNSYDTTAICKEMIQNAEDAGAEEVRFLIDMRKNEAAMVKLFDAGMRSCQGPALWVFNDAVFTDEDFANILRLGGRTKEKKPDKIGKFGTGFNSVYHITDVPCFVSRQHIQYFDPHTTYLGSVLRDKSQPGIKFKLGAKQLKRFPDQFLPFKGVFGFDLTQGDEPINYEGTLFRLPLRSKEAAQKSEVCKESYNRQSMEKLVLQIWQSSQNLLVFTRGIKKVSFFFLGENCEDPSKAKELFTIQKVPGSPVDADYNCRISVESFCREMTKEGEEFFSGAATKSKEQFDIMKVTHMGSEEAVRLAQSPEGQEHGLSPIGSVAIAFDPSIKPKHDGEIYSYLPLSICSSLPVHINASFAIKEDRKSVHRPNLHDGLPGKWNHIMLSHVICRAYLSLLSNKEFMRRVVQTYGPLPPESLWPDVDEVQKSGDCSSLFDAFYKALVHGFDGYFPAVFWKDGNPHEFCDVVVLGRDIPENMKGLVISVLQMHVKWESTASAIEVVEITSKTWQALGRVGVLDTIVSKEYDLNRFFKEVFLPKIDSLSDDQRNKLVLFFLESHTFKERLKNIVCIPANDSSDLRKPCDLIDPRGRAAPMFSESDNVFPYGEEYNAKNVLDTLENLGMSRDVISEDVFVSRCKTVSEVHKQNPHEAMKRCHAIIEYLSYECTKKYCKSTQKTLNNMRARLEEIDFLPVYREQRDDFLPWIPDDNCPTFAPPHDMYPQSKKLLVSSTCLVVDASKSWKMPPNVEEYLRLRVKHPTVEQVLEQLSKVRKHFKDASQVHSDHIVRTCRAIYQVLDEECERGCPPQLKEAFKSEDMFFIDGTFVCASKLAMRDNGIPPYLFEVSDPVSNFRHLLQGAEIKFFFEPSDFRKVLQGVHVKGRGHALDSVTLTVAIEAATRLSRCNEDPRLATFLPDEDSIMRSSADLCYCDVAWLNNEKDTVHLCHHDVTFDLAKKLGVKDIRQQILTNFSLEFPGEEFGQHEELTSRIGRILQSYPCDGTILKELLQNADDARATEIHIVYDPRKHEDKRIMGEAMKPLQGPALCVYNNQAFTEDDIKGIQSLGRGSKGDDIGKIGRYGVGFNSVYQLTDCPSFLSNGEKLCLFDPLLKYVPGSSLISPGRLFQSNAEMRNVYPDVFPCYLEDELKKETEDFTIFRFPLRTKASKLSNKTWSAAAVKTLLKDFEDVAVESLLFLKNIVKISISEVTHSGKISAKCVVSSHMTQEDLSRKKHFLNEVSNYVSSNLETDEVSPGSEVSEVIYQVTLQSQKKEEQWVISQQLGCGSDNQTIQESVQRHKLIPCGGVAACLSGGKPDRKMGRAYCFLPLPMISTDLPVHTHGYFALDHESRRHIWEGHKHDLQTKWNTCLVRDVIAPAYVHLLEWMRNFFVETQELEQKIPEGKKEQALVVLRKYHDYFPRQEKPHAYWKDLVSSVYRHIISTSSKLFPSICLTDTSSVDYVISWKTPVQSADACDHGYFFKEPIQHALHGSHVPGFMADRKDLKHILSNIGFPILETQSWALHELRNACLTFEEQGKKHVMLEISPAIVSSYLRSPNPLTTQLPTHISKSRVRDVSSLGCLIDYCRSEHGEEDDFHGLPLLLTADDVLRVFSSCEPVFASEFWKLFLYEKQEFLHIRFVPKLKHCKTVVKMLDVTAIGTLLGKCTPYLECHSACYQAMDRRLQISWFQELWRLLGSLVQGNRDDKLRSAAEIKEKLAHWAILPAVPLSRSSRIMGRDRKDIKLVALELASSIMLPGKRQQDYGDVYPILEALGVYAVEESISKSEIDLLPSIVRAGSTYDHVSQMLAYAFRHNSGCAALESSQNQRILRYFAQCKEVDILKRVKALPCFETISGSFVSIDGATSVLVVPNNIPKREQKIWMDNRSTVFLQYNHELVILYKELRICDISEIELYTKYILPSFHLLSDKCRIEHLIRMKTLIGGAEDRQKAITKLGLRNLAFITNTAGHLCKASEYFDPQNEVFATMLSRDDFPPDDVREQLGLPFLRDIGLQSEVTKKLFLSFARKIEHCGTLSSSTATSRKKSEVLISCLQRSCPLHSDSTFMQEVSEIKFLVIDAIDEHMRLLHPPRIQHESLMKYSGAVLPQHKHLIWSTEHILSLYAYCYHTCSKRHSQTLMDMVGVVSHPKLSSVINHTRNICNRLQKNKGQMSPLKDTISTILDTLLKFLCDQCQTNRQCQPTKVCEQCQIVQAELKDVPIVFLHSEGEEFLLKAEQVSRTVTENFHPYIFQAPDRLGPYLWMLCLLGATVQPSILQYAFVLKCIKDIGKNSEASCRPPKVTKMIREAAHGLYSVMSESDSQMIEAELQSVGQLYLPSRIGTVEKSDQLLFIDKGHLTARLRDYAHVIEILSEHTSVAAKAIDKLPERLRPRFASTHVTEKLTTDEKASNQCSLSVKGHCKLRQRLQENIKSPEFFQAITCIINSCRSDVKEEALQLIRDCIPRMNVKCMLHLRSVLQLDGVNIGGSEEDVSASSTSNGEILVKHVEEEDYTEAMISVADYVNNLLGNCIDDKRILPILLSQSSPKSMMAKLRKFKFDVKETDGAFELPPPGSTIPEQLYNLIEQDPWTSFTEEEYVAYAKRDGKDEYYVYACIVKIVRNDSLNTIYRIDVGMDNQIDVSVLNIHKIHMPAPTSELAIVISNTSGAEPSRVQQSTIPMGVEDAKRQVTLELEEIWKLSDEQRRTAIRRVILKWHPDKHPEGPQQLFEEAFKHLQNEIERLKKGLVPGTANFDDIFRDANRRAQADRERYSYYGGFARGSWEWRSGSQSSNFYQYFRSASSAPDLRNAQRWFRQAKEDLRAANHDIHPSDEPSLEWVVYKCCQAVEKALKAAQLAKKGSYSSTHCIFSLAQDVRDMEELNPSFMDAVTNLCHLGCSDDQKPRYPDRCAFSQIPHKTYNDMNKASEILELSGKILEMLAMCIK